MLTALELHDNRCIMAFAPVKWLRFRYEVEAMLYRVSQDIPENVSEKLIIILNIVIFYWVPEQQNSLRRITKLPAKSNLSMLTSQKRMRW